MSNFDNDYGDYELIEELGRMSETNRHIIGLFRCKICGREKKVLINNMKRGEGISHKWCIKLVGFVEPRFSRIFNIMKSRCNNPNSVKYKNYGARGIKCKYEYLIDFYDDMYRLYLEHCRLYGEDNTSIDRIDVNGHYEKGNIRWATNQIQSVNKTNVKPLYCIDRETDKYTYFNNLNSASEILNINKYNINNCVNNYSNNKQYIFKYININKNLPNLFKPSKERLLFRPMTNNRE